MNDLEYWKECISIASDECNLSLTEEQLLCLAESASGGHENYNMAFGYDCIPNPVESQAQQENRRLKKQIEEREKWELSTVPCKECTTTGSIKDGWERDITCPNCRGKGRI